MASLSSEFKIQEYVFHEVLGQGTFGITYRCTDEGLHSTVAVKEYFLKGYTQRQDDGTLTPAIESDDSSFGQGLEMFCREAQTLERLKHPNIVNVRRVFKHNGTAYIVMDYYSGSDLQAWLEEHPEPLSEVEAFTLLEPVFDALHYIHQKGFVHRDIKPSNILMHDPSEGGPLEPILLDFGAARDFLAPSDPRTVAIFTEGYAPIEQYSKHAERGPFTDIYACGALFYHLVTGEQPPSALDRAQGEILSFEAFSGSVAPVIAQAMASNANERYQSMDEFLDALQSGLSAAQLGAPQLIFPEAVVDTRVRTQLEIQAPAARSIVITAPRNGAIRGDNAAAFAVTSELPLNIGAGERASLELQCIPREEDLLRAQSSNDSGHQGGLNDPSGLAQEALQQTSPQADTQGQDSNSQDSNPQETDTQHIKTATKTAINISKEEPPHTTSQTATDMLSFSDSASLKPGAGTDDGVTATVVAQPSDTNVSPETDVPDTDHLQATEAATERLNDHARLTLRAQMYLISSDPERPKLFYELVAPVLPAPELATAVAASSRERPWRALFGRRSTAQIPARASTLNATERPAAAKLGPAGWNRRAWLNVMMAFGVVLLLGLGLWYGLTRRGEPEPVLVASIAELSRQLTDAPEGSIVRLAAGEYLLDKPLVTEGSIRVVGAGAERTRLVARGAFPAWRHMRGTLSLEALSLEGIGADPSRTQANLLELDSGGLSLLQSRLVGAPGAGVWLAAEVGQVNIQDSDLAAHGAAAIYLDGASDVRLDNSSLRASQLGLDAPAGANVNAQLTRVEQNDIGIRLAAASQLYLEDAVLAFNKQAGLLARQQSQVVLTRVDVSDQQLGVAAFNSAGVSIVESSFRNHRDIGLALFDRVQAALSSSSYQRNTWGISATPSVDITLQDITMNDNRLAGMAPVTRRLGSLPSRWAKFGRADTVQAALAAAIPTLLVAPSSGLTTSAISPSASPSVSPSEAAIVASWFSEPEYRLVSSGQASASTSNVAQLVDVVLAADATEVPLYAQPSLDAEIVGTVSQGSRHSLLTSQADWFELAEGWLPRQYAFPTAELAASKAFNDALAAGATNWQLGPGVYRLSGPLELFGNITIQGAGERETLLLVEGVHLAEDSETSAPTPQGGSETVDSTALATQPTAASTSTPSTLADVAQTPSSRPALRYLGGGTLTIRDVTLASALVSEHTSTLLEVSPWAVAPAQLELQACHFTRAQSEQAASSRSLASSSSSSSADITTADITPAGQPGSQQGHGLVLAEHASLSMQHCRVTAHPSDGLHVRGQSQSTLVSSQFIANGGAGIAMYEQASLDVQNSHFEGNGLAAIYQSANEAALVSESTFAGVGVLRALEELSTDTDLQQFINNLPAGSGIRLPAGEFYLEQSLVIDKPLSLIGASPLTGDPVVQAQAVPTASDTTSTTTSATGSTTGQAANAVGQDAAPEAGSTVTRIISRAPDALLRFSGEGTLTLRNISLEHVDSIRADIIVVNSGELILEDSFVGGAVSDGLVEIGGTGVRFRRSAQGGQLRGNTIAGNAAFAVIVDGSASPIMSNNVIVDNGQGGALFTGNSGGQLRDNRIARNGPVGVRIEGLAAPLLEGNSIFDHSFNGLAYLDSASGTAKTNVIEVSGEAGVDVRGQAAPLLEGNTIMESYRGIFYTDNAAGTAKGNTLLNNRGYGIYNASNAEPTLEDNQFEGNTPGDIGP